MTPRARPVSMQARHTKARNYQALFGRPSPATTPVFEPDYCMPEFHVNTCRTSPDIAHRNNSFSRERYPLIYASQVSDAQSIGFCKNGLLGEIRRTVLYLCRDGCCASPQDSSCDGFRTFQATGLYHRWHSKTWTSSQFIISIYRAKPIQDGACLDEQNSTQSAMGKHTYYNQNPV